MTRRTNERGASLVFTVLGLGVLTVLGLGLTSLGMVALTSATNEGELNDALAIADAGIGHAKKLMLWQEWSSFDQFLQRGNAAACDGDELAGTPLVGGAAAYPDLQSHRRGHGRRDARERRRLSVREPVRADLLQRGRHDSVDRERGRRRGLFVGAGGRAAVLGAAEHPGAAAIRLQGPRGLLAGDRRQRDPAGDVLRRRQRADHGQPWQHGVPAAADDPRRGLLRRVGQSEDDAEADGAVRGPIAVIAGTDIELTGGGSVAFQGLHDARHQIDVSGSPEIQGQLVAANAADTWYPEPGNSHYSHNNIVPLDASGRMTITGNPTVTYNGNGLFAARAVSWRECRGTDAAQPCGAP